MKRLYLIGGTMGVGKTTTCQILKRKLPNSVFLDGDWCWDMHPFQVTDETKAMVMDNICHLLNSFLACSAFENVLFCWVMHEQSILDSILSRLHTDGWELRVIYLICEPDALTARLQIDVDAGLRAPDGIERSVQRLPLYQKLPGTKLDVSRLTAEEASEQILRM